MICMNICLFGVSSNIVSGKVLMLQVPECKSAGRCRSERTVSCTLQGPFDLDGALRMVIRRLLCASLLNPCLDRLV
jgi:hypothetical protein